MNNQPTYITRLSLVFCLLGATVLATAQSLSPNSSSSANLSAAQTGPYTGKPDITIPITSLQGRTTSIPVSLTYNASGVRVEDVGSWVGLGWNLNVGGAITRTVRGADDFGNKGYFALGQQVPSSIGATCDDGTEAYDTYIKEVIDFTRDAEPDLYNLSFPGFGSQFFFDQNGVPFTVPRAEIKIEKPSSAGGQWTVTTTDGFVYLFGGTGFTESSETIVNTWYLKQIQTPLGETVDFSYVSHTTSYELAPSDMFLQMLNTTCGETDDFQTYETNVTIGSRFLQHIDIGSSRLQFVLGDRCDIVGKKLDRIKLIEAGTVMKEFRFDFSCNSVKQRLWLKALRTVGRSTDGLPANSLPPHRFEYHDKEALPAITSRAQDHWGFYNGATSNEVLTPSYLEANFAFSGANRTPSAAHMVKGLLKRVHYPFGGFTEYTFEPNDYNNYIDQYPEISEVDVSYQAAAGASDLMPDDGSDVFTINTTTTVDFDFTVDRGGAQSPGDHYVKLRKNGTDLYTWTGTNQATRTLEPGNYEIVASIGSNPSSWIAEIVASYKLLTAETSAPSTRYGGGVRIQRIRTNDGIGNSADMIQSFDYNQFGTNTTSGKLMSGPIYHYKIRSYCTTTTYTDYRVFSSTSAIPLSSSAAGAYVGYDNVTIYYEDGNGEGKSEFTYLNEEDAYITAENATFGVQRMPYAPTTGLWYKNGLMELRKDYRRYSNQFYVQSIDDPTYQFVGGVSAKGLVIGDQFIIDNKCQDLFHAYYDLNTAWIRVAESTGTQYDGDAAAIGNAFSTVTQYSYSPHNPSLVSEQRTTNSDGIVHYQQYRYTNDFENDAFGGAIGALKNEYRVAIPIQSTSRRTGGTGTLATGATVTEFGPVGTTYLPINVYSLEIDAPANYYYDFLNPLSDSRFKKQVTYTYDGEGNLIQTSREEQVSSTILGHEDKLPIAQATNAAANEIAFTSFETADLGQWSYSGATVSDAYTGANGFQGNVSKTGLPAGNYHVSLWAKAGSVSLNGTSKSAGADWTLLTWTLYNVTSASIVPTGSTIDEVRLHPDDAMMTTYTYTAGIGVTSVAGANGKASFPEYDDFNRQTVVRDFKKQIVSKKDYSLRAELYGDIQGTMDPTLNTSNTWSINLGEDLPPGVSCSWYFGDQTAPVTGASASHTYSRMGYFEIEATLSKPGYDPVVERKLIKVGGPLQGTIENGVSTVDELFDLWVSGVVANPAGTGYTWTVSDGNGNYETKSGTQIKHGYGRLGIYTVSLAIDHPHYATRTVTKSIKVSGSMSISWTGPSDLTEDESGTFVANIGDNPANAEYTWSFGDKGNIITKTFDTPTEPGSISVSVTVSHSEYDDVTSDVGPLKINYGPPIIGAGRSTGGGVNMTADNGQGPFRYEWRTKPQGSSTWSAWNSTTSSNRSYTTPDYPISTTIEVQIVDTGAHNSGATSESKKFSGLIPE